jgi:DNA-binding response OmpR family regulator
MLSSHKEGFYEITMKLFILEDELAMLEVLTKYCMSNGFEVTSWSEGMVAGKKILAAKPDLIIIDSLIPGKTGLQALGDARKLGVTAPAVLLTNSPLEDFNGEQLKTLDVQASIAKASTSLSNILSVITGILNKLPA